MPFGSENPRNGAHCQVFGYYAKEHSYSPYTLYLFRSSHIHPPSQNPKWSHIPESLVSLTIALMSIYIGKQLFSWVPGSLRVVAAICKLLGIAAMVANGGSCIG